PPRVRPGGTTNAGGRSPSRPRDGSDRSRGASASTPADLARTGALALAAAARARSRPRRLLLPAAPGTVLGRGLLGLHIGIRLLLLRRFLAALRQGLGLGGGDAGRALLLLLLGGLDQLQVGGLARVPEPVPDAHDAGVAAVALGVPRGDGRE